MSLMDKIVNTIENLATRNVRAIYIQDKDKVLDKVLELIPEDASVGFGNSQTLKQLHVSDALLSRGNIVYDKTTVTSSEEKTAQKKKALLADWFITGANAISVEGHIVNIDHSGNRVAAMLYGPEHVLIIIGINKIEDTLEQAIGRAREHAAPLNAIRAGFAPPCLTLKRCIDCKSKERVCNSLVIIEGQSYSDRMTVLLVGETLGF